MHLYLVQHGKATPKEQDPERPLTPEGRAEAKKMARFLRPLKPNVDCLWHSGKLRARQTAKVLADALAGDADPAAREGLAPNDNVALLRDEMAVATDDTMIVGHMPFVSRLATLLLTGYESPPAVTFANAAVVCLQRTADGRWQVEWIVTPKLICE